MLTQRFDEAFSLARTLHDGQVRNSTRVPYLSHLMGVSAIVLDNGGDENQAIAGLLHDGPEDAGGKATLALIETHFGHDVAAIVADCTDSWDDQKPAWQARKEAYLAALSRKPARSLLVALSDKTYNAEAIAHDHRNLGEAVWSRFSSTKQGTIWYYASLVTVFRDRMPGPLAERLSRAVARFS